MYRGNGLDGLLNAYRSSKVVSERYGTALGDTQSCAVVVGRVMAQARVQSAAQSAGSILDKRRHPIAAVKRETCWLVTNTVRRATPKYTAAGQDLEFKDFRAAMRGRREKAAMTSALDEITPLGALKVPRQQIILLAGHFPEPS